MDSVHHSTEGRERIHRWCTDRLDAWPVPHERTETTAGGARTHGATAGSGPSTVVFVAGTDFNAAASLSLATALVEAGHRLVRPDVPGRPGLSCGGCGLSSSRLSWYGTWLAEVLDAVAPTVVRPTPARIARLLRAMFAPGRLPRPELVEWMPLVTRHSRSSGAPGAAGLPARVVPRLVGTGAHEHLPAATTAPSGGARDGAELHVIPDAGHLVVGEHPCPGDRPHVRGHAELPASAPASAFTARSGTPGRRP
ncbi:alpha/beta fold hydrolase [Streptomyces sp. NPDC001389]|uniref:alpha/beta fold hydrolase n=1 Tax=Streptomyces sp. NPDC001389 TaxID=3364569 RepID=UPI00368D676F